MQPKKRCGYPGCPRTTRGRYCDEHLPIARRYYDARRGTTKERGYDKDWERVAEQRRQLDCGLCQHCLKVRLVIPSRLVDHILPIHVRPDWRLEIDNTQVLCRDCHTRKTSEDMQQYGGPNNSNLTPAQQQNRAAAQRIERPPRCDEMITT
jgi:5-methylcytosine-specific restriction endonuclease McrA